VASLREQLEEKMRLNEVMRLELDTLKRAASRARTATHSRLRCPVQQFAR